LWIQIFSPEQIHAADDDFKQYQIARFKVNFKSAIALNHRCVLFDKAPVVNQKERFPRNPTIEQGYKFWNVHPAEKPLKELVKQGGNAASRKPSDIQQDNPDFQEFPSHHVFCQQIVPGETNPQGRRLLAKKRNKKAHKNHREAKEQRRNEL
jgi:hypothetical protein